MSEPVFPVVFLGTDEVSLGGFNHLLSHPAFKVKGVITQPARPHGRGRGVHLSPVAQKATALSLPVLTPEDLKSSEFLNKVKNLKASTAIVLSYGRILPREFLALFPGRAVNFHASLLPRLRGSAPVQRAIMAGDKTLGMSLQVIKPRLDTGPLISSRAFELTTNMDAKEVFKIMDTLVKELLTDLVEYMRGGRAPIPQKEIPNLPYARKIEKHESRINWNRPAWEVFNHIRALVAGPQAYAVYKGKRLKIHKVKIHQMKIHKMKWNGEEPAQAGPAGAFPGQVVETATDHFKVACKDGVFCVLEVQPESKNSMSAGEFIRGYHLKQGDMLE